MAKQDDKTNFLKEYANRIIEDGLENCTQFDILVFYDDYDIDTKYRGHILEYIKEDERVADVYINKDGDFDIVFYTDFCPNYYEDEEEM